MIDSLQNSLQQTPKDLSLLKTQLAIAWKNCSQAERYGLEFGRICYEAQQKFRTAGGVGNKGKGIAAIWQELNIPERTAYRWINAHLEAEGLIPAKSDRSKTNDDIINALSKRLRSAKQAVQRVTDDWSGWKNCCPEASDELQKVIGEVGEFLTRLRLDSESSEPDDSLIRTAQDIVDVLQGVKSHARLLDSQAPNLFKVRFSCISKPFDKQALLDELTELLSPLGWEPYCQGRYPFMFKNPARPSTWAAQQRAAVRS